MKLPGKKRHLTDIAYISCATGIELVLVHSELTFLATNFNLVAKKKKSFWIVARTECKTNFQPCSRTTTFIFIVLAFFFYVSLLSNLSVGPFFGCLLPNFFPLLFPRFSTFWPSQESKEFRKRRKKKSLKLQV